MINLTEDQWNNLFDEADETIQQLISEFPDPIREKAEKVPCLLGSRYSPSENEHKYILGTYFHQDCGPIIMYIGRIYEHCNQDVDETMKQIQKTYLHEMGHALGLNEVEARERGL